MSSPKPLSEHVVDVLREHMQAQGLSRYRLIKVTGLKETRTYRWLSGRFAIEVDELPLVTAVLDVSVTEVMAEAERRFREQLDAVDEPAEPVDPKVQAARDKWDREREAARRRQHSDGG